MNNVPPSVRAALKRRGADDILNQEGEYQQFEPQIDKIIHGNEDIGGYIGDTESFEDYDDDATPEEKKANERIEELGDKYGMPVNTEEEIDAMQGSKAEKIANDIEEDLDDRGFVDDPTANMNRDEYIEYLENEKGWSHDEAVKQAGLFYDDLVADSHNTETVNGSKAESPDNKEKDRKDPSYLLEDENEKPKIRKHPTDGYQVSMGGNQWSEITEEDYNAYKENGYEEIEYENDEIEKDTDKILDKLEKVLSKEEFEIVQKRLLNKGRGKGES